MIESNQIPTESHEENPSHLQHLGDVMGDVSRRRGILQGQDDSPSGKVIAAMVPLGEMFGYATSMRSMSQGRATFSMEFGKYAETPKNVADAIITKYTAKRSAGE